MTGQAEPYFCVRFDVVVDFAALTEERPELATEELAIREAAERITAECWDVGAEGIEERPGQEGLELFIYTPSSVLDEVVAAGLAAGASQRIAPEPIVDNNWSQAWKEGLTAIEISERLVVRPSFIEFDLAPGQKEIVIDPGQAFGTGGHASTLLILEWLDVLAPELTSDTRVLDVGTGTGVLAFAALVLGAGRAVGFDLDPQAVIEAKLWAGRNGLADRFTAFTGGIEALDTEPYDLVVANLLRRELLPIAEQVTDCIAPGGRVLLSGLLAEEQGRVEEAMSAYGVATLGARFVKDSTGDHWVSLLMGRS
jgi:ribosomal protein L11 methyltransferase